VETGLMSQDGAKGRWVRSTSSKWAYGNQPKKGAAHYKYKTALQKKAV
jgi:hypothetical protein